MRARWLFLLMALSIGWPAAAEDKLSLKDTTAARKLYVSKCAKCHQFYEPRKYSAAEWERWMKKMGRKSKLKPEQERLLNSYLNAYRAGEIEKDR